MPHAVIVPGGGLGPAAGLLMYAGLVPERRGATVHRHWWSKRPPDPFELPIENWVRNEITPLLDAIGERPLLIAKSLGTNAAILAAERCLPAVWLTPGLTSPWIVNALRQATAPFLMVGGTADPMWDSAAARSVSPHLLEIPSADHGMCVSGPMTESLAVLARVIAAIEEFVDTIAWPT
jgi:pimeloyl-ACP methyl ester carboxylesterase